MGNDLKLFLGLHRGDKMSSWKPVVGYERYYEVSDEGLIRSLGGRRGSSVRIMSQSNIKGYPCIVLSVNGKTETKLVHRLVAEAFIGNPYILAEVNHIDGNKSNNSVKNLEWIDRGRNMRHAYDTGLINNRGENHPMVKLTENDVKDIRASKLNNVQLSSKYGVTDGTISSIRLGTTWKHIELQEAGELK